MSDMIEYNIGSLLWKDVRMWTIKERDMFYSEEFYNDDKLYASEIDKGVKMIRCLTFYYKKLYKSKNYLIVRCHKI